MVNVAALPLNTAWFIGFKVIPAAMQVTVKMAGLDVTLELSHATLTMAQSCLPLSA